MTAGSNVATAPRCGAGGFTLLEVMLASAILSTVVAVSTVYLVSMTSSVSSEMTQLALEINASRALTEIVDAMTDSRIVLPVPSPTADINSSYVQLKQPVDLSGGGNLTSDLWDEYASGNLWGVRMPGSYADQPGWVEYAFVPDDTLSESTLGDINGDGDPPPTPGDTFVRGWLVRKWHGDTTHGAGNTTGRSQRLLWGVVQTEVSPGNYGGDVDGDTNPDPIFSMAAGSNVLTINLWLYGRDGSVRHVLHNARTQVVLRNQ